VPREPQAASICPACWPATTGSSCRAVAAGDPFVRAGLRTFAVYRWRLNEGCVGVRLSLGTGTYEWR